MGKRLAAQSSRIRRGRARFWVLIAFALLVAGIVGGAAAHRWQWSWVLPVGGFLAYILAFRKALTAGPTRAIDEFWRLPFAAKRPAPRRSTSHLWRPPGLRGGQVARWDFRKSSTGQNRSTGR